MSGAIMDYVYVRNSDQVVTQVQSTKPEEAPDGHSVYEVEWSRAPLNYDKYKIIRNEDGSFINTGELHPAAKLQRRKKWIKSGQEIIAIISERNVDKGLTTNQILQMMQSFQPIMLTLLVGSLDIAKGMIAAIDPDGTLVTEEDKTIILSIMDEHLAED
jgi:hypothetical protein